MRLPLSELFDPGESGFNETELRTTAVAGFNMKHPRGEQTFRDAYVIQVINPRLILAVRRRPYPRDVRETSNARTMG